MTRGHRGPLTLRRRASSSPSPCRFIPALRKSSIWAAVDRERTRRCRSAQLCGGRRPSFWRVDRRPTESSRPQPAAPAAERGSACIAGGAGGLRARSCCRARTGTCGGTIMRPRLTPGRNRELSLRVPFRCRARCKSVLARRGRYWRRVGRSWTAK
jgi:hypothetical protein